MALRIRVLGVHRARSEGPVPAWAYHAEAYDDRDTHKRPAWECRHDHDNPLLAQSCGLEWLRDEGQESAGLESREHTSADRGETASHR
jgi:hypothetical protein